jgi:hypothetical protein
MKKGVLSPINNIFINNLAEIIIDNALFFKRVLSLQKRQDIEIHNF